MLMDQRLTFGPYRFAPQTGQLWRGKHEVSLTKKAMTLLRYLLERTGQVVSKEEVFQTVWPDTVVSDAALTSCVQELRQALRDDARKPRYIETVHRRGFRFLPPVTPQPVPRSKCQVQSFPIPVPPPPSPAPVVVGREADLRHLQAWLAQALNGARQLIFVTGEAGIGKTTLVETFVFGVRSHEKFGVMKSPKSKVQSPKVQTPNSELSSTLRWWVAVGQCIEHYGAGEAYLPIKELGVSSKEQERESGERGARSREQEAETCFLKATAIAQKQQAKSLELRAVMSLARLRQHQARNHATRTTQPETRNRLAEAHRMLSEVYHWFTEGFDTKDLQEAKDLLEELSS